MGSKAKATQVDGEKRTPSPAPPVPPNGTAKLVAPNKAVLGYASEGVKDNDIFDLPSSTWQLVGLLTVIGAFVRLFRIYQPSSVVFDEVQYVYNQLCSRIDY